ncbi:hypothetical protein [Flagellimonas allohymeniacidonis]|uniref:DUF4175 family protein n=1 Tax=Flagellimonas allohymeniacidonis TaxID=2517819 RepID=A0A4Q8QB43_9FLAO|nr:hypothetical protein [Allomuricauda hymeniacidonis]TAI47562.1 hypothetical protein EW142_12910 [Allomuricauda hymeniacidonis]
MDSYNRILEKLSQFITKYYTKQLIKGTLLFLTLGVLFWLAVLTVEFALWLDTRWRVLLFTVFVVIELFLIYKFLLVPLAYLLRFRKGISTKEASKLIGKHFPEVDDKLYNLLQLSESREKSDLLVASIQQRADGLGRVPFTQAINVKESLSYVKYVIIPLGILGIIWVTGNVGEFFNSHKRVVNYDLAYEQPAPFQFRVLNESLEVLDNQTLTLQVEIVGELTPEEVYIDIAGERLLMKRQSGTFTHRFQAPVVDTDFYLTANGWGSRTYHISSIKTPALIDFEMKLNYPGYIKKKAEVITGTGNAVVPEGTRVEWKILGRNIDSITMHQIDTSFFLKKAAKGFVIAKSVYDDLEYALSTSNSRVRNFERLEYSLGIIKDARPTIKVEQILDSISPNQSFFTGQAADDYGLSEIRLVCFPVDDKQNVQRIVLDRPNTNVHQFYYTFPSGLALIEGKEYRLYFEIVDNDGIRGGKSTRSKTFKTTLYNDKQLKDKDLEFQNTVIDNLDKSLEKYKEQQEELLKLNKEQKEENGFDFEDKNRIKDFLQKQEEQEQLMEKFSRQLKESLDKENSDSERNEMLKERLERQELEARKNEKLLDELNKLADKIDKEELKKRLDELGKKQSSGARNLEQILELTKRYYVSEKMAQMAKQLDDLSKEQEKLANEEVKQEVEMQKDLKEEFDRLAKELQELKKDNKGLKKPMEINVSESQEEGVKQDQEDALEELNKGDDGEEKGPEAQSKKQQNASQKQKSASQKMKEMSKALQQGAMSASGSSDTEDAEMLRQILDNLVTFSFNQEKLFESIEDANVDIAQFAKTVRDQKELRRLFEHVDDSLFALSLRRAELSEFVNEQITEVYYNIDKSLESIADNQIYQGASYQQYVVNATNSLADFLANILDNMQESMQSGQGSGQGSQDFQLPDIIQGQQGLQEKMNGSGKEGKSSSSGQEKGNSGEGKNGNQGKEGEGGKDGKNGTKEGTGQKGSGSEGGRGGTGELGNEGEMELSKVYEIYKEQQFIREQLEKQLEDMIRNEDRNLAKKLIRQMEDFQNDLLENGITQRTKDKVNRIQHELLKLKNASLKQGKKKERQSSTNEQQFANPITTRPDLLKDYQNNIEILNRQALPLRQNYERKVKVYFKND